MATLTPIATLDDKGQSANITAGLVAAVDLVNDFLNDGNVVIVIRNTDTNAKTLTISGQPDPFGRGGSTVGDVVLNLAAGNVTPQIDLSSLLNPAMFNIGGKCTTTIAGTGGVTGVSIGLYRLRKLR